MSDVSEVIVVAPREVPVAPVEQESGRLAGWFSGQRWWITRILVLPVHVVVYAVGVFFLVRLIPGDPILTITGGRGLPAADDAAARKSLGLNGSLPDQLGTYLNNLIHADLGHSVITHDSVLHDISQRLPATLELAILAMLISIAVTLAFGQFAVSHPRNSISVVINGYARAAGAIPDFVMGVALIFICYAELRLVPAPLGIVDTLQNPPATVTGFPLIDALIAGDATIFGSICAHLALPVAVMAVTYTPMLLKLYLTSLSEESDAASTNFRVATGARRRIVLLSAIRRALPPMVAMCGAVFGYLIGGAVVIEQLFGMPGMGQYAVNAVTTSDITALQGFLIVVAILSLVVFLIVDILTMALDPRRRPGAVGGGGGSS